MMDDNALLIATETLAGLLPELERLDRRLALATAAAAARYGPHAARDAFRGLHLDAAGRATVDDWCRRHWTGQARAAVESVAHV